jgi:hypothetical protein
MTDRLILFLIMIYRSSSCCGSGALRGASATQIRVFEFCRIRDFLSRSLSGFRFVDFSYVNVDIYYV